jgi:hypothetical protein
VLSSNPGNWLAAVLLREPSFSRLQEGAVLRFLSRLLSERPFFVPHSILGFAILKLYFDFFESEPIQNLLSSLIEIKGIRESIAESLTWYLIDPKKSSPNHYYFLRRRFQYHNNYELLTPEGCKISTALLNSLLDEFPIQMYVFQGDIDLVRPFDKSNFK